MDVTEVLNLPETWAKRFGSVALVNSLIAVIWLIFPVFIDTRISRTIAGGSVGTWGYLGFLLFVTVGFAGFTGFAFLYYTVPKTSRGRINGVLAWLHLSLMELGTLGATALLGLAGYIGGTTILEETGKGTTAREIPRIVHSKIGFVIEPVPLIAVFTGLAAIGVLIGVVGIFSTYMRSDLQIPAK